MGRAVESRMTRKCKFNATPTAKTMTWTAREKSIEHKEKVNLNLFGAPEQTERGANGRGRSIVNIYKIYTQQIYTECLPVCLSLRACVFGGLLSAVVGRLGLSKSRVLQSDWLAPNRASVLEFSKSKRRSWEATTNQP